MTKSILVTGCAGFIGFHTAKRLLDAGVSVFGIDNINAYYSQELKQDRLAVLSENKSFRFNKIDISEREAVADLCKQIQPQCVIHLAAQAGVRWSIENPWAYLDSNLTGFLSILEACRHNQVGHLIYASSSSVYGSNKKLPFSVEDSVDHPISLYAATKKANELMAHTYSHLYRLPTTGLRFFTVYGPWGRPDMALWKFAEAILEGRPIDIYNYGQMKRDFTFIDDVVESTIRLIDKPFKPTISQTCDSSTSAVRTAPWRVFNVGNHSPVKLLYVVELLEKCLGKQALKNYLPIQPGDVETTYADIEKLVEVIGYTPQTSIECGIEKFATWFGQYSSQKNNQAHLSKAA